MPGTQGRDGLASHSGACEHIPTELRVSPYW